MDTPREIIKDLMVSAFRQDWEKVIEIFKQHTKCFTTKITNSEDTVLHVAATHGADNTLVQLLNAMEEKDREATKKALAAKNKQGDTPLHCAAARNSPSSPTMCKRLVAIAPSLVGDRNNERETPLFLAALHVQKETFLYLYSVAKNLFPSTMTTPWRRKGGETILHSTIQREYLDLAFDIIHLYNDQYIASSIDEKGLTPLHVLASKPSAFESGTRLRWWTKILYYCTVVEPRKVPVTDSTEYEVLQLEEEPQNRSQDSLVVNITDEPGNIWTAFFNKTELPKNYYTCHDFFKFLWDLVRSVTSKEGIGRNLERDAGHPTSSENSFFPLNCATCFEFFKFLYMSFYNQLVIGLMGIKKIKQKHVLCAQIMEELIKQNSEYEWIDGSDPSIDQSDEDERESFLDVINKAKNNSSPTDPTNANGAQQDQQDAQLEKMDESLEALLTKLLKVKQDPEIEEMDKRMTALLVAAKNGVIEIVKRILDFIPVAIYDKTKEGKSILHVAVENRQPRIFNELMTHPLWDSLIETVDVNGNNVLHLAAQTSKYKPWQIPGSAAQMQWEIKWYQYVKERVPQHLIFQTNKDDYTPWEIFTESHKELVKDVASGLKARLILSLLWLYTSPAFRLPHTAKSLVVLTTKLGNQT